MTDSTSLPAGPDALKSDDRREALEALRDLLAETLRGCPIGVRAQTAAQYRAALAELAALPDVKKVSKADELAARRAARRAAAEPEAQAT